MTDTEVTKKSCIEIKGEAAWDEASSVCNCGDNSFFVVDAGCMPGK
jgi:hypothetical protein